MGKEREGGREGRQSRRVTGLNRSQSKVPSDPGHQTFRSGTLCLGSSPSRSYLDSRFSVYRRYFGESLGVSRDGKVQDGYAVVGRFW